MKRRMFVGPRTLEGVYPGEVVEVNQIIHRDGNTFLRLADDRGWVYEKHFKVRQQAIKTLRLLKLQFRIITYFYFVEE